VRLGQRASESLATVTSLREQLHENGSLFRATGPGWQTRINDTLRRAAKLKARA
jgi:hypothetical protein